MGLKKGALTFSVFAVSDPLPGDFASCFDARIKAAAFRGFFPENDEKSVGWTGLQDLLDTELTAAGHTVGDYRVFSLRIDRKAVPGALLRLRLREAERNLTAARGVKKLPREEKEALRTEVYRELLKQTLPVPSLFDVCWSLARGKIYFTSLGEKVLQEFQDRFRETFSMTPTLHVPWLDALTAAGTVSEEPPDYLSKDPGREFLTWLWFKSEERNGRITLGGGEEIGLFFVRRLVLVSGRGEYAETVVCQGPHASLREGREALRQGKKIREARLALEIDADEWEFTFKADLFQFQSMKLPTGAEKFEEPEETQGEGLLLERIYLMEKAMAVMERLFAVYLELRNSPAWTAETARIDSWANRKQ